jgi:hypothetical protein
MQLMKAACLAALLFAPGVILAQNELPAQPVESAILDNHTLLRAIRPDNPRSTAWKISVGALVAANVADVASSWGKKELNPLLSGPGETFGARSVLIKAAIVGSVIGMEYLATRGHNRKGSSRMMTILNFVNASGFAGLAARNFQISR